MTNKSRKKMDLEVNLWVHGDELDPATISDVTGVHAVRSWRKSDTYRGGALGVRQLRRVGMWHYKATGSLSDAHSIIGQVCGLLHEVPELKVGNFGIESIKLATLFQIDADSVDVHYVEFELSSDLIECLRNAGATFYQTITLDRDTPND